MSNMGWKSNNSTSRKTNNIIKKWAEFAAKWTDLEIILLSEIRKRKTNAM